MNKDSTILIVGDGHVIEQGLCQSFQTQGYTHVFVSSAMGLNPTIQTSVYEFFQKHRPQYVFLSSTRSGGIEANRKNPGEFLYHNLESQNNIIYSAWKFAAKKLLFIGASCVYPKNASQPMKEEYLLTGPLEETSEAYALAKIAGIKLCQSYRRQYGFNAIAVIPATVYGPYEEKDVAVSHVMGALMAKFKEAVKNSSKDVVVWGTGNARREFIYIDDFVDACLFLMERYDEENMINVGVGSDVSIKELAEMITLATGFKGKMTFDTSKPDGASRKLLDNGRLTQMGWRPKTSLMEGIKKTL